MIAVILLYAILIWVSLMLHSRLRYWRDLFHLRDEQYRELAELKLPLIEDLEGRGKKES